MKIVFNLLCAAVVVVIVWRLFFYRIVPYVIGQYGKATKASRKYERDIERAHKNL